MKENYGGQNLWIGRVKEMLKVQLDRHDDNQIIYTMQKLTRTNPDEVHAILASLAPEFAAWFKRLAVDKNSPGSAINDLVWIHNYTDLWPELLAAVDECKPVIMRYLLRSIRDNHTDQVAGFIKDLEAIGVRWPEFRIMKGSLLEQDEKEHDGEDFEYGKAWRAKLEFQEFLKDLRHDIQTETWDLVALDLIDIGMTEVEDVVPARTKELIENNKDGIMFGILQRMKVSRYTHLTVHAVDALNNIGINWPELNVIRRSLESDQEGDR